MTAVNNAESLSFVNPRSISLQWHVFNLINCPFVLVYLKIVVDMHLCIQKLSPKISLSVVRLKLPFLRFPKYSYINKNPKIQAEIHQSLLSQFSLVVGFFTVKLPVKKLDTAECRNPNVQTPNNAKSRTIVCLNRS